MFTPAQQLIALLRRRCATLLFTFTQGGTLSSHASFRFNWVRDSRGLHPLVVCPHLFSVVYALPLQVHDSRGLGLRFDAGEDGLFGDGNQLAFNVAMRNLQVRCASPCCPRRPHRHHPRLRSRLYHLLHHHPRLYALASTALSTASIPTTSPPCATCRVA